MKLPYYEIMASRQDGTDSSWGKEREFTAALLKSRDIETMLLLVNKEAPFHRRSKTVFLVHHFMNWKSREKSIVHSRLIK